jgi:hypothetical protein
MPSPCLTVSWQRLRCLAVRRERGQSGRWGNIASHVEAHDLPATDVSMLREPDVALVASFLREQVGRVAEENAT